MPSARGRPEESRFAHAERQRRLGAVADKFTIQSIMHGSWRAEVDLKGAILQRLHENDALGRADVGRARRDEAMDAGS